MLGDNGDVTEGLIEMAVATATASCGAGHIDRRAPTPSSVRTDDIIAGSGAADIVLDGGADNDIVVGDGALFTYNSPVVVRKPTPARKATATC